MVQIIDATKMPRQNRGRFANLIAEPDATEQAVTEAVNDTLKAISASLLMEQVLPLVSFELRTDDGPKEGFDYGEDGYKKDR